METYAIIAISVVGGFFGVGGVYCMFNRHIFGRYHAKTHMNMEEMTKNNTIVPMNAV